MRGKEINELIQTGELAKADLPAEAVKEAEVSEELLEAAEAHANKQIADIKEENRKRKRNLIKLGAMTLLSVIIFIFTTIAWFTQNREVSSGSMAIKTAPSPFELKTTGDTGLYDGFLDETVPGYGSGTTTASSANIKWKLTRNTSEIHNRYNGEGTPNLREITRRDSSDYGLKPGDSGTLKFSIVPNVSGELSINLKLDVIGYEAEFELQNDVYYKNNKPLTLVTNETVKHFLASHIYFFYKDSQNNKHIIGSDGFNVSVTEETEVTLYWVWPATLKEILDENIEGLDDTGASNEVKRLFFEHPEYFLKTVGSESLDNIVVPSMENKTAQDAAIAQKLPLVYGRNYTEYGAMYNDADQAIGDNVNYILVDLTADTENS